MLLLDWADTALGEQMYVRNQMFEYMNKMKPGTTLAVFTLSSHARLRMIEGFSTDAVKLSMDLQAKKIAPMDAFQRR